MNSNTLDKTKDPGKDGAVYPSGLFAARNERVAKDVVGFSLGYYGGDYSPIGGNPAEAAYAGTAFGNGADDLFNGNIRHMVTAIEGLAIQGYAYRYDQLQRIKQMQVYRASDVQSLFAWTNSSATDEYKTTFTYDRNGNLLSLDRNGIGTELDMDRFVYNYHNIGGEKSNRLNYVVDNGTDYSAYDDIKSGQATGNYTYNKIGELVSDASEDMIVHWRTGDHKLSKIIRNDQDSPQLEFFYNPFGQRALKIEKPRVSGVIQAASQWNYTYYSYDANGQVMAVYSGNFQGSSEQVKLSEQHLYGAERLGMINRNVVVFDNGTTSYTHKEEDIVHTDERGRKRYELLGHTNSVLAVISDRKMYNSVDGNYEPVMISWADYYLFGMLQSGRHGSATSELYRYQFQSMETDRGISGNGNSYTTEFRQYDPRLGRWKSLDPLMAEFPHSSPYVAFANNPVYFTDPYGLEPVNDGGDGGEDGSDGGDDWDYGPLEDLGNNMYKTEDGRFLYKTEDGYSQVLNTVEVDPSNKASYQHLKESNISSTHFLQLYKQYRWDRYDGNYVDFRGTGMHRRLQEQFDLVVWDNTLDLLNGFGVATVIAASGGALAPAALEIGGALLSTLPELEAIITYYYITAEAAYFNTVYTLSKYVAGRVLIYTTSIVIGTSAPSVRNGGVPTTQTLYSRGSVLRAPVGGVDLPGGGFAKGGRWYSGPRLFFQRNAVNIPDPGVLNPWEPWPRNTMIDVGLSNPWIRGGAVGLGSYGAYKHMELQYKLRNE